MYGQGALSDPGDVAGSLPFPAIQAHISNCHTSSVASIDRRIKSGPDGKPYTRWVARWRDATGKQRSKVFTRKGAAEQYLASQVVSLSMGTYVDPSAGKVTLRAFFDEWSQRQVWAPATRKSITTTVDDFPYADLPLRRLARSHMESYVKARSTALAASTLKIRVTHLRQILRAAVADRLISRDPTEGVRLPRTASTRASMVIPSPADVKALMDTSNGHMKVAVALAAFAGLRQGEVLGLRVEDVDWTRRALMIRRQVQDRRVTALKTRASERDVPVPDDLLTLLSQHVPADGGFLMQNINREPLGRATVVTAFARACRRVCVEGVTFHDLRHFYASGLISEGCDVVTVQHALGHASASITLDTYSHLWPNAEDRTRSAAARVMSDALGRTPGAQAASAAEGP